MILESHACMTLCSRSYSGWQVRGGVEPSQGALPPMFFGRKNGEGEAVDRDDTEFNEVWGDSFNNLAGLW